MTHRKLLHLHAVEGQHARLPLNRLLRRPEEIREGDVLPAGDRGGHQQRRVLRRNALGFGPLRAAQRRKVRLRLLTSVGS